MHSFRLRLSGVVAATGLAAFLMGVHPGVALAAGGAATCHGGSVASGT